MIKEAFGKGTTTEAAIEAAKNELGAPWDADVQIEVIKTAKKKTLGLFGGSLAEVRAYYDVPDEVKKTAPKQSKPQKTAKPENKTETKKPTVPEVSETDKVEAVKTVGEASKIAEEYIKSVLIGMGVDDVKASADEDDDCVYVQLDCGNDFGFVIGRRGETLDAIQYLTRLVVNKGKDGYKRVSINAGNYREKREETLRELAKKNSARVKKYGRNVCLDPMNPYERRIIHTTVQEIEGVTSHSIGSESDRRVVITLADGFKATNLSNNRGRRGDYRRGDNRSQSKESAGSARAPRSDLAGSLYGKIEPKNKE